MKLNIIKISGRPGKNWKLETPFGTINDSERLGIRHGIMLAKAKLLAFKMRGRKSNPPAYRIEDGHLFTFQGRFERGKPVFYRWI